MNLRLNTIVFLGIMTLNESGYMGINGSDYLFLDGDVSFTPQLVQYENILFYSGVKGALRFGYTDDNPFPYLSLSQLGYYSFAFGAASEASATTSFAGGQNAKASGLASVALGYGPIASGSYSFAGGIYSQASATGSVAIGYYPRATGSYSVAFGSGAKATATAAVSVGYQTEAKHAYSSVFGYYTDSYDSYEFVVGRLNSSSVSLYDDFDGDGVVDSVPAQALFIVGNGGVSYGDGMSISGNSNAFLVYEDGTARSTGNLVVDGEIIGNVPPRGGISMGVFTSSH